MQRQKKMEESFLGAHRDFMKNLDSSIKVLESDIDEANEMQQICTDEWCKATESYLDELAKMVYSISEPRWQSEEDSKRIRDLRRRIHDLYARYSATAST